MTQRTAAGQVHVSSDAGVGRIVLDNPAKLNAISLGMWRTVVEALATFENDTSVRCVVITGQGDKAFCVGADIDEKDREARESGTDQNRVALDALERIAQFTKPTIAMVAGYCMGGGLALALACDLRIAGAGSRFGIPAARLGLAYGYSPVKRLSDLVGPSTAKRMLFTADRFSADDALRFGLVDDVVAVDALSSTVTAMAARIAANAPLTIVAAKHAVATVFSGATEHDVAAFAERERACIESEDYAEGRRAFLEKRTPVFRGR